MQRFDLSFGDYLPATLYTPSGSMGPKGEALPSGRLPAFVWLAPESLAHGYSASYLGTGKLPTAMGRAGLAMFCFDPIGTGMRLTEATRFYERYPRWSLLGKMVHDARRAIDSLLQIPAIDPAGTLWHPQTREGFRLFEEIKDWEYLEG